MATENEIPSAEMKSIVVVGGGMTGWTVAAGLASGLRGMNIRITLIDDNALLESDLAIEVTTPSAIAFHRMLGINEKDFMKEVQAGFTLATEYSAWSSANQSYFLPYADHGFMMQRIEFAQFILGQPSTDAGKHFDDYSLSAVAAKAGRFRHPSQDQSSLFSTLSYGYQIPCESYANYLMKYAKALGVDIIASALLSAELTSTGSVKHLMTQGISGQEIISADFFIDCTGDKAWLMSKISNASIVQSEFLFTNTSASFSSHHQENISPSSQLSLAPAGWCQTTHAPKCKEIRYFFNGTYGTHEQANAWMVKQYKLKSIDDIHINSHVVGQRTEPWQKNCLTIGQSASYAETFAVGKLHFVQSAVLRFLSLFPASLNEVLQAQEYNRLTQAEYCHVSDFHSLHYQLAKPCGSPFWAMVQSAEISERLRHKLSLFNARGIIPFYENETLSNGIWVSLLLGCGVEPLSYDPMVDEIDAQWRQAQLTKMKKMFTDAALSMPEYKDYLLAI